MTTEGRWAAAILPLVVVQPTLMLAVYQLAETRADARLIFGAGMLFVSLWLCMAIARAAAGPEPIIISVGAIALFVMAASVRGVDVPFEWVAWSVALQACLVACWAALWGVLRSDPLSHDLPATLARHGALASFVGLCFAIVVNFRLRDPWAVSPAYEQKPLWDALTGMPTPMLLVWGVWIVASLSAWQRWRWPGA